MTGGWSPGIAVGNSWPCSRSWTPIIRAQGDPPHHSRQPFGALFPRDPRLSGHAVQPVPLCTCPEHESWLNRVETLSGSMVRTFLRHRPGRASNAELEARILQGWRRPAPLRSSTGGRSSICWSPDLGETICQPRRAQDGHKAVADPLALLVAGADEQPFAHKGGGGWLGRRRRAGEVYRRSVVGPRCPAISPIRARGACDNACGGRARRWGKGYRP